MKASEAIAILQSLDPSHEVTIILGTKYPKALPNIPKWDGTPGYPPGYREFWINKDAFPPGTITCGTVQ